MKETKLIDKDSEDMPNIDLILLNDSKIREIANMAYPDDVELQYAFINGMKMCLQIAYPNKAI